MYQLSMRAYQTEDDFWRIRNFLREVFVLNDRRMLSWPLMRWDYWRWHGIQNLGDGQLETDVTLWETEQGQIAAVLNRESAGQAFLQVHPAYKSADLDDWMIAQAEMKLRIQSRRGDEALWVWCDVSDVERQGVLVNRGYTQIEKENENQWRRDLLIPIPNKPVKQGFVLRALGDASELPSRSWASWRAFHSDEPDDHYGGDWTWYQNIQAAPLYRRDLDLVAIAPGGELVAFTTAWYDDVTRSGVFEPVGTVPEHQRQGLASSLLCEGMRRLQKIGAIQVFVSGGELPANSLYRSIFGPVHDLSQPWEKRWQHYLG